MFWKIHFSVFSFESVLNYSSQFSFYSPRLGRLETIAARQDGVGTHYMPTQGDSTATTWRCRSAVQYRAVIDERASIDERTSVSYVNSKVPHCQKLFCAEGLPESFNCQSCDGNKADTRVHVGILMQISITPYLPCSGDASNSSRRQAVTSTIRSTFSASTCIPCHCRSWARRLRFHRRRRAGMSLLEGVDSRPSCAHVLIEAAAGPEMLDLNRRSFSGCRLLWTVYCILLDSPPGKPAAISKPLQLLRRLTFSCSANGSFTRLMVVPLVHYMKRAGA
jgi:hypothetical protein